MKVLIVDDTTFMRTTIRRMLEANDIKDLVEAVNGLEAVEKYKIHRPDLVIMDISMPIMDGIQAVKEIKASSPEANIIICSLQGQKANVMDAIKSGARSFLLKPIKEDKLMAEIKRIPFGMASSQSTAAPEIDTEALNEIKDSEDYLKGIEEGYLECRREVATNMLRMGVAMEIISCCVELSDIEVAQFKKDYKIT